MMEGRCAGLTASLQRKLQKIREQCAASYPMHSKKRGQEGEVVLLVSEHKVWDMKFKRMKLLLQFCFLKFKPVFGCRSDIYLF